MLAHHQWGDGEEAGGGTEGKEDSDSPRGREDNRERLLQEEIRELSRHILRVERRTFWLFLVVLVLLLFVAWFS